MRKQILAACLMLGVLVMTSNAFASRARELVLGTGDAGIILGQGWQTGTTLGGAGSLYYEDDYNIFYNPAYINDFKNFGIVEKSNAPGNSAMGGFVAGISNINLGVFFNRASAIQAYNGNPNIPNMRPIEVMVGSDMGVKWGVAAEYGGTHNAGGSDNDLTLRAGVSVSEFEPFAHFKVLGVDTTGTNDHSWTAGLRYHWGEWVPYVVARQDWQSINNTDINKFGGWGLGLGRETKMGDSGKMMYAISYWRDGSSTINRNVVPIDFGLEGEVTNWLVLRGGVSYHIFDRAANVTVPDNTSARIGASIKVMKAELAFAIGKASITNQTASTNEQSTGAGAPANANNADAQTFDLGNGFFTAASLSYHW